MPASAPASARVDYGLDAPREFRRLIWRGSMLILLGAGLYIMNRADAPRGGMSLFMALGIVGAGFLAAAWLKYRASRVGKLELRDRILDQLPWRGDEKVLDVGC